MLGFFISFFYYVVLCAVSTVKQTVCSKGAVVFIVYKSCFEKVGALWLSGAYVGIKLVWRSFCKKVWLHALQQALYATTTLFT